MPDSTDSPLVTVVTVVLNSERFIQKTIESVRNQNYQNKEFIIIDGGSSDNTVTIIKDNIDCVTTLICEKDNGIYDAMNKGIKLADPKSKLITFLNAGDEFYDKNVIRDVVENIETTLTHLYGDISEDNKVKVVSNRINEFVLSTNMICHQAIFFITEIHRKYLYDTQFKICADYKLLIDMVKNGETFSKLNRTIVKFDSSGVSKNDRATLHAEKNVIRKKHLNIYIYHLIKIGMKKVRYILSK